MCLQVTRVKRDEVGGLLAFVQKHACEHLLQRVETVAERRNDAKVCAGSTHGPEQIRIAIGDGHQRLAVGGDHVGREQVVTGGPVLTHQIAQAATNRKSTEARVRNLASGCCQAVSLSRGGRLARAAFTETPFIAEGRSSARLRIRLFRQHCDRRLQHSAASPPSARVSRLCEHRGE